MVQPLGGLQPLTTQTRLIDDQSQATPEERSGSPVNPKHSEWGETAKPYPWQSSLAMGGSHGPYGLENSLLDDEFWWLSPPGVPDDDPAMDKTPYRTHAGPHPQGILSGEIPGETPDAVSRQRWQSMLVHGVKTNAATRGILPPQALGVQNDDWTDFWVMNPGDTRLQPMSRQQMSSHFMFGSRDRTQTFAPQNDYDFDAAHMHRRYATGSIPGNYMWLKPGGRLLIKNMAGVSKPAIGQGSPFEGDNIMQDFDPHGALLMNTPYEYVPPAQPTLARNPASYAPSDSGAVVEWY